MKKDKVKAIMVNGKMAKLIIIIIFVGSYFEAILVGSLSW